MSLRTLTPRLLAATVVVAGAMLPLSAQAAPETPAVSVPTSTEADGGIVTPQFETICQMAPRLPFICYRPGQ